MPKGKEYKDLHRRDQLLNQFKMDSDYSVNQDVYLREERFPITTNTTAIIEQLGKWGFESQAVVETRRNDVFWMDIHDKGTGTEHPPKGAKVSMHYTGTLLDGSKFDSSRDRGRPFTFTFGAGQVIRCWEIGVGKMVKGMKATFNCPADIAYGDRAMGNTIPAGSTLRFDVEMIDFE